MAVHLQDGNLKRGAPGRAGTEGAAVMNDTYEAEAAAGTTLSRYSELKQMLVERRREIQAEVQGKMRGVREEGT